MPQPVQLIYDDQTAPLPAAYPLPPGSDFEFGSVTARISGAGASGRFIPVLDVLSQDDKVIASGRPDQEFAAGDTGVVTWAPFLKRSTRFVPSASVNALAGSPQSIPTATFTDVAYDTIAWDNDDLYSAATPTRLTPTRPGRWMAVAYVFWALAPAGTFLRISIREGVTGRLVTNSTVASATAGMPLNVSGIFNFPGAPAAGEFLTVRVYQDSGAGLVVNADNIGRGLTWLGPE